VSELAVTAVGLPPLVEQGQDRLGLLGEQPVQWGPAGALVDQLPAGPAGQPAVCPDLAELKFETGPAHRPAGLEGLGQQVQRPGLGGRVHPAGDPAT
jgi:hypothetical protein